MLEHLPCQYFGNRRKCPCVFTVFIFMQYIDEESFRIKTKSAYCSVKEYEELCICTLKAETFPPLRLGTCIVLVQDWLTSSRPNQGPSSYWISSRSDIITTKDWLLPRGLRWTHSAVIQWLTHFPLTSYPLLPPFFAAVSLWITPSSLLPFQKLAPIQKKKVYLHN